MNKNLLIVARYNEDLDWLQEIDQPFLIYNKGKEWPYNVPRKDIFNKGREAETYLRAIIENYDSLNKFQNFIFLQGDPLDHATDLKKQIEENQDNETVSFLCDGKGAVVIENNIYLESCHVDMIRLLLTQSYNNESGANKCLFMLNFMGIDFIKAQWEYSCGAQYIVPTKMLLNKSYEWWQNAYRVYDQYVNFHSGDPALIMEFIWPIIWDFSENKKELTPLELQY